MCELQELRKPLPIWGKDRGTDGQNGGAVSGLNERGLLYDQLVYYNGIDDIAYIISEYRHRLPCTFVRQYGILVIRERQN